MLATLLLCACASTERSPLTALERNLAAQPSATAVLQARCQRGTNGDAPAIRAEQVPGATPRLRTDLLRRLNPADSEPTRVRHVRLSCGGVTFSEAYNWYLPLRLPGDAAQRLETTDTPFGKVLAPYGFTRSRLWSKRGRAAECPAGTVLSQSAVLELPGMGPISLVIECYTAAAL